MAKKIISILTLSALVAGFAMAEDTAGPKVSAEFVQRMDTEMVDDAVTATSTFGTDAVYSRTEIKGSAAWTLSDLIGLTFSAKDRFELRLNPGNLESVDLGIEYLGKIRGRNRVYLNLDGSFAFDKAFKLVAGLEFRQASDLRTDKEGTVYPELRVAPALTASGKIDILSYSTSNVLDLYLDTTDNGTDDVYAEYEGTHAVELGLKIDDATTAKIALSDYIDMVFPKSAAASAGDVATILNMLALKATLATKEFSPSAGLIMNTVLDNSGTLTDNVVGGTCSFEFKKDAITFSVGGEMGVNVADGRDNRLETHLTSQVKIKF